MSAGEMRHEQTTDRHRDCADYESPGGDDDHRSDRGQAQRSEVKKQIYRAETKERNMRQPIEPPFQTIISAQPILAIKEQTQPSPEPNPSRIPSQAAIRFSFSVCIVIPLYVLLSSSYNARGAKRVN